MVQHSKFYIDGAWQEAASKKSLPVINPANEEPLYEIALGPGLRDLMFAWGLVPQRLTLALEGGAEPAWSAGLPLVSSMFLHGGWLHLLGDMWYLSIFGDNVEDRLGHVGFLLFYLASGIAGGILHVVVHPGSRIPTVGASGAIAGVLGGYLVAHPGARVITLVPFPLFQVLALPAVLVLGLWILTQVFSGAVALSWTGERDGGVAWWGHIGGFVFGGLTMLLAGRGRRRAASRAWPE